MRVEEEEVEGQTNYEQKQGGMLLSVKGLGGATEA